MASSNQISVDRTKVISALEAAVAEIETKVTQFEKDTKAYPALIKAWDKKASEYLLKKGKMSYENDDDDDIIRSNVTNNKYDSYVYITLKLAKNDSGFLKATGEYPVKPKAPKEACYDHDSKVCILQEVKSALALYKMSTETTVKIGVKSVWIGYIK